MYTHTGWWFGTMEFYDFPFSSECHNPNWLSFFCRGVETRIKLECHGKIGEWWYTSGFGGIPFSENPSTIYIYNYIYIYTNIAIQSAVGSRINHDHDKSIWRVFSATSRHLGTSTLQAVGHVFAHVFPIVSPCESPGFFDIPDPVHHRFSWIAKVRPFLLDKKATVAVFHLCLHVGLSQNLEPRNLLEYRRVLQQ